MRKFLIAATLMFVPCAAGSPAYADVSVSEIQAIQNMAKTICPAANDAAIQSRDADSTVQALMNAVNKTSLNDEQKLLLLNDCIMFERGFIAGAEYRSAI